MPDPRSLFADRLPTLDAQRVRLRPVEARDLDALLAVFGDAAALAFWSHRPLANLDAARAYLDGIEAGRRRRDLLQWAIADREDDRLIGTATLAA